jgi:hypothetical protein
MKAPGRIFIVYFSAAATALQASAGWAAGQPTAVSNLPVVTGERQKPKKNARPEAKKPEAAEKKPPAKDGKI